MKKAFLFTFAVFTSVLIFGGSMYFTGFSSDSTDVSAEYTFEKEPVDVEGFKNYEQLTSEAPTRIIINSVDIDIPVQKSYVANGYWEVFSDKAGWGNGSGYPGEVGNQVIFAHAKDGLFKPLEEVVTGDKVLVLTDSSWYEYEVFEIKDVYPNELEVIAPTEDERLTLYTCSGYKDEKRLVVTAKRI